MLRFFAVLGAFLVIQPSLAQPTQFLKPLAEDGIHDPTSPGFSKLQEPREALESFPRRPSGEVNWVETIQQKLIQPRGSVEGDKKLTVVDLDIQMKNTASMPPVNFSHKAHTQILSCANCHPAVFVPKAGANFITMNNIIDGQFCGVCHGTVAFDIRDCAQCHAEKPIRRGLR